MSQDADDDGRSGSLATSMLAGTAPNGQSYVLAINEYCQRHFRADVRYVYARRGAEYSATAVLDGLTYATGRDPNKHVAKILAAKSTAEVLLPEMRDVEADGHLPDTYKLEIFDNVDLADERIPEITMPHPAVKPYNLLLRCLDRNFGYSQSDIKLTTHRAATEYCSPRLSLSVGSYSVSVPLTRFAKQEAAQTILMNVHPHLESWGSLVRMYAVNTARNFEDMTMLAGIQNAAMQDAEDGVAPGEDKGEPRTAFRGDQDDGEGSDEDSLESESDGDEDDADDEDDDDKDDGEDDDEEKENELEVGALPVCRDRRVLEPIYSDEEGEGDDGQEGGEQDGVAADRDLNFNLRGAEEAPDRHNAFYGRLSFGDLPAIGDDIEALLLEPLLAPPASTARTTAAAASCVAQSPAPSPASSATSATSEAPHPAVGPLPPLPPPGEDAPLRRRRRSPRPAAWSEDLAAGEVPDGPPLLWCDMPSSFADIFKDWPHRRHQDEHQDGHQDDRQDEGAALSTLFGLKIDAGKGDLEDSRN